MTHRPGTRNQIPPFLTIEDAAAFWETHDSAEFEEEFEAVEIQVDRPLRHVLEVEFDAVAFHRLVALAKERGVTAGDLVRSWTDEAIHRAAPVIQRNAGGDSRNVVDEETSAEDGDTHPGDALFFSMRRLMGDRGPSKGEVRTDTQGFSAEVVARVCQQVEQITEDSKATTGERVSPWSRARGMLNDLRD